MKKIIIIGSSGAGKSTLARRVHEITGIEAIHLDKLYWQANWVEPPKDEWKRTVESLLKKDSWIIDGHYGSTLEMRIKACDTVIFLDLPRTICLRQAFKRFLFYRGKSRPDIAEGCNEKFDFEFFKWIWGFPKRTKPRIEALLEQSKDTKKIVRLNSKREIENFLNLYLSKKIYNEID